MQSLHLQFDKGGRQRKILVSSTNPVAWQCLGTDRRSFTYSENKTGPGIEPCATPTVEGMGSEIQMAMLTTWFVVLKVASKPVTLQH